jgi:APA family basic amino acid/polyamine antiporter
MTTQPQTSSAQTDLKRELSLLDAVMINAGTMIASAIFIVPATVAAAVHGSVLITAVWVIGGMVSLLGALSVAELAAMYPEAGGQYAYLREATARSGPSSTDEPAWSSTASIAAIAVGFADTSDSSRTPLSEAAIR